MAKRETDTQRESRLLDFFKRFEDQCAVLCTNDFADPENPKPIGALVGEASRDIDDLAKQIRRCCSDEKWTPFQKRVACEELVKLAVLSTGSLNRLVSEFPERFREIAEERPEFPCLFPAHAEELPRLKTMMWDELNLGKRFALKLRAAPGRKTFSTKTWTNKLLIGMIQRVLEFARIQHDLDPGEKKTFKTDCREVVYHVPLTPPNAKQWLNVLWEVLLLEIPNPEMHPRLRQLVERPSLRKKRMRLDGAVGEKTQAHNMRADIKRKLGVYLKRMLNDSGVHK
jgi:hypothetical protein